MCDRGADFPVRSKPGESEEPDKIRMRQIFERCCGLESPRPVSNLIVFDSSFNQVPMSCLNPSGGSLVLLVTPVCANWSKASESGTQEPAFPGSGRASADGTNAVICHIVTRQG